MSTTKPPIWFWLISGLALLWNAMGAWSYLSQVRMTEAFSSRYSTEQLQAMADMPKWLTAVFAIAVWAGLLGALALILRKRWAKPLFLLSLLAIIVQSIYNFFMSNNKEVFGDQAYYFPIFILVIGAFLLWFAGMARKKGWIG